MAHWILRLRGAGISSADAALAMGVFTIATLAGRFVGGVLMDIMNARLAFALSFGLYFIGSYLALIVRADKLILAYVASAFCTARLMAGPSAVPARSLRIRSAAFPKLYGTMTLMFAACASPAGYVAGKMFDISGNYTRAIELNCVLAVIGVAAISLAAMPKPPGLAGCSAVADVTVVKSHDVTSQ